MATNVAHGNSLVTAHRKACGFKRDTTVHIRTPQNGRKKHAGRHARKTAVKMRSRTGTRIPGLDPNLRGAVCLARVAAACRRCPGLLKNTQQGAAQVAERIERN